MARASLRSATVAALVATVAFAASAEAQTISRDGVLGAVQTYRAADPPATPAAHPDLTLAQLRRLQTTRTACTRLTGRTGCTMGELVDACHTAGLTYLDCEAWAANLAGQPAGWTNRDVPTTARKPPRPGEAPRPAGGAGSGTPTPSAGAKADPAAGPASVTEDNLHGTSHDLLADNGLRSPWCQPGQQLNTKARRNCHSAGLASSGAGGDNANFDRHVDTSSWTGAPKIDRWFISILLTVLSMVWTLMVTLTRGVFAVLEFAFAFNPLDASHRGSWTGQLQTQVHAITGPLALVLAPVGAVWIAWTAGANQQPGHAIRHAVYSMLIVAACLVVLANPVATIGSLVTASQQAGVAVIGLTSGQPGRGQLAAQAGLQAMADGVIDQPLALLEFGDTDWGTNPRRLDPRLKDAALALARDESPGKVAAVRAATSNLDLFEVWPANSAQRNSINDEHSLLRALCGSDDATGCKGENADRAEFRTERGAWQRALGLVVIVLGLIPFWTAVGFCAIKIIAASLLSVIRLLQLTFLTPIALIGEQGTQRLTSFAGQWAGNILAAAIYSFFLGLIMLTWRLVTTWPGYGFVMQWLLLMVAVWQLIAHRDRLWGTVHTPGGAAMGAGGYMARYMAMTLGTRGAVAGTRTARHAASAGRRGARRVAVLPLGAARRAAHRAKGGWDRRGATTLEADTATAPATAGVGAAGPRGTPASDAGVVAGGGVRPPSRQRLQGARRALAAQNQRVAKAAAAQREHVTASVDLPALRMRRARINGQLASVQEALPTARGRERQRLLRRQASLMRRQAEINTQARNVGVAKHATTSATQDPRKDIGIRARWIDRQAGLPRGATGKGERRDYAKLAALLGASPGIYRQASASQRLAMRARIDRELDRRVAHRHVIANAASTRRSGAPQAVPRPAKGAPAPDDRRPQTTGRPEHDARPAADPVGRREAFRRQARREEQS